MILLLLGLLAALGARASDDDKTSPSKTGKLVEKIRRQLMEDNYDYLPTEEELMPVHHYDQDGPNDALHDQDSVEDMHRDENNKDDDNTNDKYGLNKNEKDNDNNKNDDIDRDDSVDRGKSNDRGHNNDRANNHGRAAVKNRLNINNRNNNDPPNGEYFVPRAKDLEHAKDTTRAKGHVVAKKDLLYYVDDDRLRGLRPGHNRVGNSSASEDFDDDNATEAEAPNTSTVKYKVIEVKSKHPNRRSGPARRFLQEQWAGGVALISLDGAPFPEFRLPRARRQYMRARDSDAPPP